MIFNRNYKERKMKKIFQWKEYLYWNKMTSDQKINFKRACLFPLLVYIVYVFLYKYSLPILIIIGIYFLVRLKNINKLNK